MLNISDDEFSDLVFGRGGSGGVVRIDRPTDGVGFSKTGFVLYAMDSRPWMTLHHQGGPGNASVEARDTEVSLVLLEGREGGRGATD